MALITGGTSGIGAATAERFLEAGAEVAIVGRDTTRGTALEERPGATFVRCDVTDDSQVRAMVAEVVRRLGRIDVLFNNAGIINFGSVVDPRLDEWDLLMATNVRGVFLVSRHVLPHMIGNGGGSNINMGSNLGWSADGRWPPPRHRASFDIALLERAGHVVPSVPSDRDWRLRSRVTGRCAARPSPCWPARYRAPAPDP